MLNPVRQLGRSKVHDYF